MLFLNAMIDNGNLQEGDAELFFGGDEPEPVETFPAGTTMIYVETKVTVYPGPVRVDYEKNRVVRSGAANVLIRKQ